MTVTLITGANKGIGFETARQMLAWATPSTSARATCSAARRPPRSSGLVSCSST